MSDPAGDGVEMTLREFSSGQKLFGRYTLKKILGRGGMGIVWLAQDEELERDVALKFLPDPVIHDRSLLHELKGETRRSLELTHKNIVRIYDFVQSENSACISMEYIDGDTLSNLRTAKEQKVFQPNELSVWTAQLCDALDYAHNHARIIHRDLKPANLMVNKKSDLKVSDFGIARSLGDTASRLTLEQGRSGTLVYMSPQQLDGEHGTHLDDIYSLGATLYDLLTSKPPFYSGNLDRQIHERTAPSMAERRKDLNIEPASLPAIWEEVVAACLKKEPSQRPQSTAEIGNRLGLDVPRKGWSRPITITRRKKKALAIMGIAALVAIGLAGLYFGALPRPGKPVAAPASPLGGIHDKSIAVLPFENRSSDKENAFFADGVQDEILTALAKVANLKVISRTSVMQFREAEKRNLRDIAQQLRVAYVLEGSVERADNRVRVIAQLIDARTDAHIWAERYNRDLADIFAIQSEIAQRITQQLQVVLSPQEKATIEAKPTHDFAAYDLYLRAKKHLQDYVTSGSFAEPEQAIRLLDEAVARDPAFVPALCLLARAHVGTYWFGADPTESRLELARKALNAAAQLRPDDGEVHVNRAYLHFWGARDYEAALSEAALARRTLPNDASVLIVTGFVERRQGYWDDSARHLEEAMALDPRNLVIPVELGRVNYFWTRRYEDAMRVFESVLSWKPNDFGALKAIADIDQYARADLRRKQSLLSSEAAKMAKADRLAAARLELALLQRDYRAGSEILSALPSGVELPGDSIPPREWFQALIALGLGDPEKARSSFEAARERAAATLKKRPDDSKALMILAQIDGRLGRRDDALREGERAVELLPVAKDAVDGPVILTQLANIHAQLGDRTRALDLLEQVTKIPNSEANYGELKLDERWDPLRKEPRFEKILAALAPK